MIYRIFSKNSFVAFALLPVILVALRARLILDQRPIALDEVHMPMWELFLSALRGNSYAPTALAIVLTLIGALGVNRIANVYSFTEKQSNLAGYFYIVFSSAFIMVQQLQPILLFVPFFLIGIERLFIGATQQHPMRHCFDAGLVISAATLFYGKGIWFLGLLLLGMGMMRIFNLRSFMAVCLGILLPYLFSATWYAVKQQLPAYLDQILENFLSPVAFFNHNLMSEIYLGTASLFILIGMLSAVRRMTMVKIITRKYFRFMLWMVLFPLALIFTPYFSFDVFPILAIGASVMAASLILHWQKVAWQEFLALGFLALTLLTQWLVA